MARTVSGAQSQTTTLSEFHSIAYKFHVQRPGRERVRESGGRRSPSGGGLCWTKVGIRRIPEDTRPREEAWSPLLGADAFFISRYGPGNVIQWGWSKGKTSKIMIKGGARGVIWLVEISPAFGVTTRGRRGGCPLSPLSSSFISVPHSNARPLSALSLSVAPLSLSFYPSSSVSLYRTFAVVALCSSFPFLLTPGILFISSSSSFVPYVEAHTRIYTEEVTLFSSPYRSMVHDRVLTLAGASVFSPTFAPSFPRTPFRRLLHHLLFFFFFFFFFFLFLRVLLSCSSSYTQTSSSTPHVV